MSGYPELDELTPHLAALQSRTDFRSREWHQAAEAVGVVFDAVAAKRDELDAWLVKASAWLDAHPDHERHAEHLKTFLLCRQKHQSYQRALDRAADAIVGLAEPIHNDEPADETGTDDMATNEGTKRRDVLANRVRQRRKSAA